MPRPCFHDHPLRPQDCRLCLWSVDFSEQGEYYRRLWGEPECSDWDATSPDKPTREIVPGLADPIPQPEFQAMPEWWLHDPGVVRKHREALLGLARGEMPLAGTRNGHGVVMAGGGRYWPGNVVSVKMLRDTGSTLPVQIWHRGDQEPVRPGDLEGIPGIEIRDLTVLQPIPRIVRGWEAKTLAILASGWERILFLDSDAYCLRDPADLLNRLSAEEPFLYWEDQPWGWDNVKWAVWGRPGSAIPPVQGGQYALHTKHFWRELVLSHWLDQHSDFSYSHQYGDQDSWRVALEMTGGRYTCLGKSMLNSAAVLCHLDDNPFVVHRCGSKLFYQEDMPPNNPVVEKCGWLPGEDRVWAHWETLLAARTAMELSKENSLFQESML